MAIVVSDTSPIRALNHLGLLSVLRDLYGVVYIPEQVAVELQRANAVCPAIDPAAFPFLLIEPPRDKAKVATIQNLLDQGEAEALVLAVEKAAAFVLIDKRAGRAYAIRMGLKPVGVLAVLASAKEKNLLPHVRPLIDRLQRELQFFLSPQVIAAVLQRVKE